MCVLAQVGVINPREPPPLPFLTLFAVTPSVETFPPLTHISNTQPEEPADTSDQSHLLHANLVI